MNEALYPALCALVGVVLTKVVERILPSRDKQLEQVTSYYQALREENATLRKDARDAGKESDTRDDAHSESLKARDKIISERDATIIELRGDVHNLNEQLIFWKQRWQGAQPMPSQKPKEPN